MAYRKQKRRLGSLVPAGANLHTDVQEAMRLQYDAKAAPTPQTNPEMFARFTPAQLARLEASANTKQTRLRPSTEPDLLSKMRQRDGVVYRPDYETSTPTKPLTEADYFNNRPFALQNAMNLADTLKAAVGSGAQAANTTGQTDIPPAIEDTLNLTMSLRDATAGDQTQYTAQVKGGAGSAVDELVQTTLTDADRALGIRRGYGSCKDWPWWVWLVGGLGAAVAAGTIYSATRKQ